MVILSLEGRVALTRPGVGESEITISHIIQQVLILNRKICAQLTSMLGISISASSTCSIMTRNPTISIFSILCWHFSIGKNKKDDKKTHFGAEINSQDLNVGHE
jgi:hypothetical protein